MPSGNGDVASLKDYVATCAKIEALFSDCDAVYMIVAGDFNCNMHSRFYRLFQQFLNDNKLVCSDTSRLVDVFTYYRDDGSATSWIDHFTCSPVIDRHILQVVVMSDCLSSDHRPLSVLLAVSVDANRGFSNASAQAARVHYHWNSASPTDLAAYSNILNNELSSVNIPKSLLGCSFNCEHSCNREDLDNYYRDIMSCVTVSTDHTIRSSAGVYDNSHNVPGWSDVVAEKHTTAWAAFLDWVSLGKPRSGIHVLTLSWHYTTAVNTVREQVHRVLWRRWKAWRHHAFQRGAIW